MAYHDQSPDPASQIEGTLAQLEILARQHPEIMHDPSIVAAEHDPLQLQLALQAWEHNNGADPNNVYDPHGTLQDSSWFSDNLPWITALMGGALVAPAAIGALGGGSAAAASGGLDALGPSTAGSIAATGAAGAAPEGIAGLTAGAGAGLTGGGASGGAGLGSHLLNSLTSEKGLATLASLGGPALAEALAPKPQQLQSFAGGPNDPNAAEQATTGKLNDLYGKLSSRQFSLPDANLSMPTTHYSGGGLPMDIGLTGSTQPAGVQRVSAGTGPQATPDDYASAHQALQLLVPQGRSDH